MAKTVKCPECNNLIEKSKSVSYKKRYYCPSCLEEKINRMDSWDKLFNIITNLYEIDKPTAMMFKQLKDYRAAPYNFTDEGMYLTLKYYYYILGNSIKEDTGVGIIPYYYERAKQYFLSIYDLEEIIENHEEKEDVITIKTKDFNKASDKKVLDIEVDWSEISESED